MPLCTSWGEKTIRRAVLVALLFCILGGAAVLAHLSHTTADYSRYNVEWNGTSRLFEMIDEHGGAIFSDLPGPIWEGDALLLVVAPRDDVPEEVYGEIRDFLSRGNCVVIATESEGSNSLLREIGSTVRIKDADIISLDRLVDHPSSVLAFPSGEDPLFSGIARVVLNSPAFIEGGSPVFSTSVLTFRDIDGDGRLGRGEVLEKLPVVAVERIGNGTLYVISDAGIFINGMLASNPRTGNEEFIRKILSYKPVPIVDQGISRTAEAGVVIRVVNLVKDSTSIKMGIITLVMLAMTLLLLTGRKRP
ncbi:MAG: DUF4350 domain-containing protein [Methanolinea sp.]|nr:DUF4350 domain-containing protein [Methanolinea sp.]